MKSTNSIFLLSGLLALYTSMTCTLIPNFLKCDSIKDLNNTEEHSAGTSNNQQLILITSEEFQENKKKEISLDTRETELTREQEYLSTETNSKDVPLPQYTKGIYISNWIAQSKEKIKYFIEKAHLYKLNTFVIDVQKRMISQEIINMIKAAQIFPVARVVVAEGGLRQKKFSEQHIGEIIQLIDDASVQGFGEVQLDYIRYADIKNLLGLSLTYKYNVIRSFLKRTKEAADRNHIYLSADLFGRITLNQHDQIGQKLEIFAKYTQTIYPMLYPSHYTNDYARISNPYATIKEGVEKSKARLPNRRIVAYIQGFKMKVKPSRLNFVNYIKMQIKACSDGSSDGWVIWNSRNKYQASFQAIEKYTEEQATAKTNIQDKTHL